MPSNFNAPPPPSPVGLNSSLIIGMGAFLIILGCLAAFDAVTTTLASMVILGVLLIVAGVVQVLQSFAHRGFSGSSHWFSALVGALYIIGGILLIEEPASGSIFLTVVLAGCMIFAGISRAAWASSHRLGNNRWGVLAVSGLFTLAIGILLYLTLPWSGLWLIGMFIAVELVMAGVATLMFGLALRETR